MSLEIYLLRHAETACSQRGVNCGALDSVIIEIESGYKNSNMWVVSQKTTLRIILCSLMGIDIDRYRDRINTPAVSVSIVKFDVHGPMLEILGDRNYMPRYLSERAGT